MDEAIDAARRHEDGEGREQHGPGEPSEGVHLARPEGVARVAGVAPRVHVGERRDPEGGGVGGHVQAVGQERHRGEGEPGDDLHHHHRRGDRDHEQGAALSGPADLLPEGVAVLPAGQVVVHGVRIPGTAQSGYNPTVAPTLEEKP